jgi:integrase
MLATGCHVSEALALRRSDVYVDGSEVFIDLTGTIVYSEGVGSYRQETTMNGATAEHLRLTSAAAAALRRRALGGEHEFLFSTRRGGALQQQNISKQLRQVVAGTELEWLISHVFRKTSGTAVYRAKGIDATQEHLRHLYRATTEGAYEEKEIQAEDHTNVLEELVNHPE